MNQKQLIKRLAAGNDLFAYRLGEKKTLSMGMIRRRRENAAKPDDFGEFDRLVLSEAKAACRRRQQKTGIAWAVDHMIPLGRGGKHAWHNIQVIPERLNQFKGDRMIMTKPLEWLDFMIMKTLFDI